MLSSKFENRLKKNIDKEEIRIKNIVTTYKNKTGPIMSMSNIPIQVQTKTDHHQEKRRINMYANRLARTLYPPYNSESKLLINNDDVIKLYPLPEVIRLAQEDRRNKILNSEEKERIIFEEKQKFLSLVNSIKGNPVEVKQSRPLFHPFMKVDNHETRKIKKSISYNRLQIYKNKVIFPKRDFIYLPGVNENEKENLIKESYNFDETDFAIDPITKEIRKLSKLEFPKASSDSNSDIAIMHLMKNARVKKKKNLDEEQFPISLPTKDYSRLMKAGGKSESIIFQSPKNISPKNNSSRNKSAKKMKMWSSPFQNEKLVESLDLSKKPNSPLVRNNSANYKLSNKRVTSIPKPLYHLGDIKKKSEKIMDGILEKEFEVYDKNNRGMDLITAKYIDKLTKYGNLPIKKIYYSNRNTSGKDKEESPRSRIPTKIIYSATKVRSSLKSMMPEVSKENSPVINIYSTENTNFNK